MGKTKYYSLDKILQFNADYNLIYGERSNGKTTAVLDYALRDYINSGYKNQLAIIRRWEEDFKGKNGSQLFDGIIALGWVDKYTKGKYNTITFISQRWYLAKFDQDGKKLYQSELPFAFAFSIASEEHVKSTAYPDIKTILFDEFITRSYYLPDEFVKFTGLISTIVRLRDDLKIFMCGNTVNKYCPYFAEMGLSNIRKQARGTIDLYTYGEGEGTLRVAVEYSDFDGKQKKSNKYFAFNNPKLNMIKHGEWEIALYPHLPVKYTEKDIKYIYFIKFNEDLLQCEIIYSRELKSLFTFIHRKTTPIKQDNKNLVFQVDTDGRYNYRRKITKPFDDLGKRIYEFYLKDKVFYQDNEVGEIVRNYILWCKKESVA